MNASARPRFDGVPADGSPTTLPLLDWIIPLAREDAEGLREPARLAARPTAQLKWRLTDLGVQAIYASDNDRMLIGLTTEWCVLFTANDAYVRGSSL